MHDMVVYVDVAKDENLRFGIRSGNQRGNGTSDDSNSGWFKCDNFRIKRVSESADVPMAVPSSPLHPCTTVSPAYSLSGRSEVARQGIRIHRFPDGTYRKVVVK
jgi:hypothetical protein